MFSSAGVSKISNSLIDDQTQMALSFYSSISNDRDDLSNSLIGLSNTDSERLSEKQIKSMFDNLSFDDVKEAIQSVIDSLNLGKMEF